MPKKVDEPFSLALTLFVEMYLPSYDCSNFRVTSKRYKENQPNSQYPKGTAMTVDIEIICIGNELLIGKIKDTNAHYLAKQATQLRCKRQTSNRNPRHRRRNRQNNQRSHSPKTPVHNHYRRVRTNLRRQNPPRHRQSIKPQTRS